MFKKLIILVLFAFELSANPTVVIYEKNLAAQEQAVIKSDLKHDGNWEEMNKKYLFSCMDADEIPNFPRVNPLLVFSLCNMARELGESKIHVTSAFRKSQHHFGNAIDFYLGYYPGDRCGQLKKYIRDSKRIRETHQYRSIQGISSWGEYFNLTFHFDIRGDRERSWGQEKDGTFLDLQTFRKRLALEMKEACSA